MPFEIAKPISKKQFLEVYKESVFITQLIFAPFGLSPSIANILGESNAIDTYTLMFQQWEDVVSKRIFSARGFDDDRIIASMHKFVGGSDSQDSEVVNEVREACEALKKMIRIPSVVEFDFRQIVSPTTTEPMFDLCTSQITAKLLSKVITILQSLFIEDESEKLENEIHSSTTSTDLKNEVDSEVFEAFKLSIPCNVFSPSRFYASKSSTVHRRLCSRQMVATLRNALNFTATELVDNAADVAAPAFTATFSLQQFHAMLDIHRASADVQQVLSQYCATSTDSATIGNLLNEIRIGSQLVSINHANQLPTVSYIEQLTALLPHSVIPPLSEAEKEAQRQKQEKESGEEDSGEESTEASDSENKSEEPNKDSVSSAADETTAATESAETADNNHAKSESEDQNASAPACPYSEAEIAQMIASLDLALAAVRLLQEGKEAAVVGDLDTAIDCISQVINKYTNSLVDEEDEELAEELREKLNMGDSSESKEVVKSAEDKKLSRLVLPVFLRVQLYTERATYYAEQGELADALEDISIAIELDRFNVSAYSLRSQIATAQFAQEQEAAAAALEEDDDDPYAGLRYGKPKKGAKAKKTKKAQGEEDNEVVVTSPVVLEKVSMDTAAEDALAAFLLGGCTDLELAAAAEETAREQCRLNAKDIFRDRVLRDQDVSATGDIGAETTTASPADEATAAGVSTAADSSLLQDNLPRSWLVGSYFSGYTQLSSALDVHSTKEEEESVRNTLNGSAQHHSTGSLNDICDDDNSGGVDATAVAGDLARPPAHLLDPVAASTTETVAGADPDAESHDIDESSPEDVTGGDGLQALDKEGYSLLVQLVREMETATYSSNNNSNSAAKDMVIGGQLPESANDENDADTDGKKASKVVYDVTAASAEDSSEWDHLESLFAAGQLRLCDQGLLEPVEEGEQRGYDGWKHVSVGTEVVTSSEASADVETETPQAEATDATEVSLTADSSESVGQPCPHFKAAIALLRSDLAYQLTGVRLNRNGTIAHLDYDTYKSSFVSPQDTPVGEERDSDGEEEESPRKAKMSGKSKTGKKDKKHGDRKKSAKKTKKAAHHFSPHSLHESSSEGDDDDDEYFQGGESGEDMDEDELYAFMAAAASGIAGAEWNMNNASFGEDEDDSDEDYVPGQSDSGDSNKSLSGDDDDEEDDEGAWESCSDDSQEDQGKEHKETVADSNHEEEEDGEWEDCDSSESEAEEQQPEWKKTTPPPTKKSVSDSIRVALAKGQPPTAAVAADQDSESQQTSADHTEKAAAEVSSDNATSNPAVDSSFFAEVSIISCEDLPAFDNTFLEEGEEDYEEQGEKPLDVAEDVLPVAGDNVEVEIGGPHSVVSASQETNPAVGDAANTVVLPEINLSHKLRARLLNICGSVAYLSGDATGAVACLRASLLEDASLLDSKVKLGSLLIDMDEQAEAAKLLKEAKKSEPNNAVVLLHMAELFINQNDFEAAVKYLRKAQRAVPFYHSNRSAGSSEALKERERMERVNLEDIQANAAALLGISLFRINPTRPDIAISVLEEGLSEHPNSVILLICSGEVQSQAGDMVRALQSFRKANALDGRNPLPFINAARTYQQLGQFETASAHIRTAIAMDPALAMTRVDLAQNLMQSGRTEEALDMLNIALSLARQVSEIRDVLTARNVANMQLKLERAGLYIPVR